MKISATKPVTPAQGFKTTGSVSRERVNDRTHELAALSGRASPQIVQADYEQAKRDVTGESDHDRQDAILDSPPPPDPGLGSTRRRVPDATTEEENREERSLEEQTFEAGARKAEQDKVNEAAHAAAENDRVAR